MEEGTGRGLFNISELVWVNVEKSWNITVRIAGLWANNRTRDFQVQACKPLDSDATEWHWQKYSNEMC
jgi:hypothetical protein